MMSLRTRDNDSPQTRKRPWRRLAALGLSVGLWVGLSLCYFFRFDACAAVTIFPPWVWLAPGLLLTGLGWSRHGQRAVVVVALLWLLYLLLFVEEPKSLIRRRPFPDPDWKTARQRGKALRLVSLNCAGGRAKAGAEVERYQPDIVLLQETPWRFHVEALARRLFKEEAGVLCGVDVSLIARGKVLVQRDSPARAALRSMWSRHPHRTKRPVANFIHARVELTSGIAVEVINFHPPPAPLRLDLWSLDCWRAHAQHRQSQREQLGVVAQQIDSLPRTVPLIVGGDFNVPAGDAIFRLLQPRLRDTFREGGTGWGATFMNDLPLLRIDQIWVSDHFRAAAVVARKTQHSDHRMVVCDLWLR